MSKFTKNKVQKSFSGKRKIVLINSQLYFGQLIKLIMGRPNHSMFLLVPCHRLCSGIPKDQPSQATRTPAPKQSRVQIPLHSGSRSSLPRT